MDAQRRAGWSVTDSGRRWQAVVVAMVLLGGLVPLAGCDRLRRGDGGSSRPPVEGGGVTASTRPALPARGPGLASLAVFPETDAPLKVVNTQPADGAQGVPAGHDQMRIVVQFNHPVVPLVPVDEQGDLPVPITVEPKVTGEGKWLNTSTYILEPTEDLAAASIYKVTFDRNLKDVLGASLGEAVTFTFSTAAPMVVTSYPPANAVDAGATEPISVTFDQAMDHDSTERGLSVVRAPDREPVEGRYRWIGNTLEFQPAVPLAHGASYIATVARSARAASGQATLAADYPIRFSVAPLPQVVRTSPADGDRRATIDGSLSIRFNTPMRTDGLTVTIQPTITDQYVGWDDNAREAMVSGGWLASMAYTVTVPADTPSRYGDPLGKDTVIRFTSSPMAPSLWLHTSGNYGLHNGYEKPVVYLDAVNFPKATLELYSVPLDDFLGFTVSSNSWERWDNYAPEPGRRVRQWTVDTSDEVDVTRRVSTTLAAARDGRLAPGIYFLRTGQGQRYMPVVSTTNLALKRTQTEALVWATDLRTGDPVANLPIAVYDSSGQPLARGTTDRDGVFRGSFPARTDAWRTMVAVSEVGGQVVAAVSSDWSDGIDPWSFNFGYDPEHRPFYANVYTDRPIYRAGQTVYFRGVIRADDDATYALPGLKTVHATVRDPNSETVLDTDLTVSPFGTVSGEIPLSVAARLGDYSIEITTAGTTPDTGYPGASGSEGRWIASAGFRVSAYRKPEYEVEVTTEKAQYAQGETIKATATAVYYFGGPVVDAKVHWRLLTDDFFFRPDVDGWWDFIDYDLTEERFNNAQGEVVSEGEGKTDADGRFVFEVPADLAEVPLSQVFTLDVEVTDINNQAVSGRASATVHKANLYLGLRPAEYVSGAGKPAAFDVLALDENGQAVAQHKVDLALFQRTWYSVKEKREGGDFYWTSHYTDTLVTASTVTTDAEGKASATFTPRVGGVHRLVATANDAAGNEARSATYAWITDRAYINWRPENNDRIQLVADKKSYLPGETAAILVPAPFAGARALLTVERGRIREVRSLLLKGNSETVQVPIRSDYTPNVYVSIMLVKGVGPDSPLPQFKLGYTNLSVSTREKELGVTITPDRSGTYGPREKVTYDVRATDYTGKPVQAELSLALVDKALLALTDDTSTPLKEAFYGQRSLAIGTSAALTKSVDRLNQELAAEKKGGGGGLTEAGTVRRLFRDTAYWNASVTTDAAGHASVAVDLPDNLTTWRLDARAVTGADTLVGSSTSDIVTTKPVLVRPVLPRFLVVGDAVQLETVVNNSTDKTLDLTVTLAVVGVDVADGAPQTLTVPAGGKGKVVWQVTVPGDKANPPTLPGALGEVTVQMAAQGGGYEDTVELSLPVYPFNNAEVVATAGEVRERSVTEKITLPKDVDTTQGALTVEVNPSLAAASLDSLKWLEAYPYDCTEQTASKFLPNVATYLALRDLVKDDRADLKANLEVQVAAGAQRLYALQNADGGWGWWGGEQSRRWLTAYVLFGLDMAQQAGFAVSPDTLARAEGWLVASLDHSVDAEDTIDVGERAFAVFVLAERGNLPPSRVVSLYDRRGKVDLEGAAFLAMALADVDETGQQSRIDGLLAQIGGAAVPSATGTYWDEDAHDPWDMGNDERTTSVMLYALSRLDPENVNATPALRWLMVQRRESHWETTQSTAWAVLALAERMRATGELQANYTFNVELNQAEMGKGQVTAANVDQAVTMTAAVADLAAQGSNDLTIRRNGPGNLYYTAQLRAYRPAASMPALDRGIIIGRQYFRTDPKTLLGTGEAIDQAAIGDVVQVKLAIIAPNSLHYVLVEDPLPAGFEILDTSLKTTSAAARSPEFGEVVEDAQDLPWWERHWWSYWVESQLRDEKAALFATYLGEGTYEYTYLIRASVAGNYNVIPARAEQMYFPEVFGRSAGGVFTVTVK
jgi:alpha-2-macroglobulin